MKKEPLILYLFRFFMGAALLAFMIMLYWSSAIIEEEMLSLTADLTEVKSSIRSLRDDLNRTRNEMIQTIQDQPHPSPGAKPVRTSNVRLPGHLRHRPHIDKTLPNLLEEDPFYQVTLPKLLGPGFRPHGTLYGATVGRPDNLHPFSNWSETSSWQRSCLVSVAGQAFGRYETQTPDMAIKMEVRTRKDTDAPEFWVHLRDNVFWQPLNPKHFPADFKLASHFLEKHQVTAHDFKLYFDAIMNPDLQLPGVVALRSYYSDVESIEVIDDLTFVVRWRTQMVPDASGKMIPRSKYIAKFWTGGLQPLASFVYLYYPDGSKILEDDSAPDAYRTSSVWAQTFAQHWAKNIIVSCGPWLFDGMTERQIQFVRNPDFYDPLAALIEERVVYLRDNVDSIWQDFKAGKLATYGLQPDQLIEWEDFQQAPIYEEQKKANKEIKRLDYIGRSFFYVGWNQNTPYFSSKKVRRAMTLAIDRNRIINQNLNGQGVRINGPFFRYSPNYNDSIEPWEYDPITARRLLEEEGWYDSDGDGVLDKEINGRRIAFTFTLTYFVKNPTTKAICEYIATALREIGIVCSLNGVDLADLSQKFDDRSFDALSLGWALGAPPEDPRQLWYSTYAKEKGSSNAVGFANAEADAIIDALDFEYDAKKRIALYHRFGEIIHEEQPYTFLYSPKTALLYRSFLQNVFIPAERQDLIPGANVGEPSSEIFWIKES